MTALLAACALFAAASANDMGSLSADAEHAAKRDAPTPKALPPRYTLKVRYD